MTVDVDDLLNTVKERANPQRVTVKLRKVKDKYYIDFDGSKSYTDVADWTKYWSCFEHWVSYALSFSSFTPIEVKTTGPAQCSVFVGTLFHFLVKKHD
jgi:hypothetical protein